MFYRVISRNIDTPVQNPVEPQVQIGEIVAPPPPPPTEIQSSGVKKKIVSHLMMALQEKLADLN